MSGNLDLLWNNTIKKWNLKEKSNLKMESSKCCIEYCSLNILYICRIDCKCMSDGVTNDAKNFYFSINIFTLSNVS